MATERAPLFVRLSAPLLSELEARIDIEGRTKQAVVEDLLSQQLQAPADDRDVLDLAAVASMLRVSEQAVLDRISSGDFPARRFGSTWRFSRTAVAAWLHGSDTISDRPTGFASG